MIQRLQKFSSWKGVVAAVARIQSFLKNTSNDLTIVELVEAERTVLKLLQAECFGEELGMNETCPTQEQSTQETGSICGQ